MSNFKSYTSRKPAVFGSSRKGPKSKKRFPLRLPGKTKRRKYIAPAGIPELTISDIPEAEQSQQNKSGLRSSRPQYIKLRKNEVESWKLIRSALCKVQIENQCPASYICDYCSKDENEIITCEDCGFDSTMCSECCQQIHSGKLLHVAWQWKVKNLSTFKYQS